MTPVNPTATPGVAVPPLKEGERLSRDEFERRYNAMPELKKAELINGVVLMPSPVRHEQHGNPHAYLTTWLATYEISTPGTSIGDNSTIRLDLDNEPQPDDTLMIRPECGGNARIDADGYIEGGPELVAEVAASSVNIDLTSKLQACTAMASASTWSGGSSTRPLTGSSCSPASTIGSRRCRTGPCGAKSFRACGSMSPRWCP